MVGMRNLVLLFVLLGQPAHASLSSEAEQLHIFANCAGRLSALMEHQWNNDTSRANETAAQRATMVELVHAIMPADAGRDVLSIQVNAKAAYAQLLRRASSNPDPEDAAWAARRAAALVQDCTDMLL